MPQEQETFQRAVKGMLDAVMFENWIRFYFLQEEDSGGDEPRLVIDIPDKGMARIRELFPEFAPMAEELNGKEASLEVSRSAVCGYIHDTFEGTLIPQGAMSSYFDTHAFQTGLQLFNIWVQAYEKLLDGHFLDFAGWQKEFARWRESEHGAQIESGILAELKRHDQ